MILESYLKNKSPFIGLFLGKQGCGKTSAIASFCEEGRMLCYDLDKRIAGIRGSLNFLPSDILSKIEVEQFSIKDGFAAIDKALEILIIKQSSNPTYKTIWIDSASTFHDFLLEDSKKLRGAKSMTSGKVRGTIQFNDPDDYNYASTAFQKLFYVFLGELKCNLIFSGWVVDRYAKPPNEPYANAEVVGQKLLATDKFAERIPGLFDEVYFFSKEETVMSSDPLHYKVEFENNIAKTSQPNLRSKGKVDITNKSFYQVWKNLVNNSNQ